MHVACCACRRRLLCLHPVHPPAVRVGPAIPPTRLAGPPLTDDRPALPELPLIDDHPPRPAPPAASSVHLARAIARIQLPPLPFLPVPTLDLSCPSKAICEQPEAPQQAQQGEEGEDEAATEEEEQQQAAVPAAAAPSSPK